MSNDEDCQEEIYICPPKYFRFKNSNKLVINPPSSTIHVSNLKKEFCEKTNFSDIFGVFGKIEAIKLMCSNERNMCLIKYYNFEDSFRAIAYLHDKEFHGRKMQISFTRSKIY